MALVNMSYYERVSEGDTNFIAQMIRTFLEDVPQMVNALEQACDHQKFEEIARLAHKLKPAWSMCGLTIHPLEELENAAKCTFDISIIENNMKEIRATATKATEELQGILRKYSS